MNNNQSTRILPVAINELLQQQFHFPENVLFAQVATQANTVPHLRTMRLYGIEEPHGMILLTHRHARKWHDLQQNPKLALCFIHSNYTLQLLAECQVTLAQYDTHPDLFEKYWDMIKPDVKKIYSDDYPTNICYEKEYHIDIPSHPPLNMGMIIATPYFWESMLIGDDHPNSLRYHYIKNDQPEWIAQRMTVS